MKIQYLDKGTLFSAETFKITYDAKVMAQNVDPYFSRVEGSETKLFLRKDRAFSALSDYI